MEPLLAGRPSVVVQILFLLFEFLIFICMLCGLEKKSKHANRFWRCKFEIFRPVEEVRAPGFIRAGFHASTERQSFFLRAMSFCP